ncbi:Butyryl-CoA dehydrogenase [Euzebya pacifica]|uniref:Butyryl-CoA dehydrogenase n=1 Tax=Euzebya pacifica TaxID=1608957 RepID=A0A346XUC6_9ACTN|nr:acyl-CoA dehydrogenase family protein [Euzebya pacifica]AXV05823.1 Butyryl-CoA dehydrogenase [Euzebya pacifica]
MNFDLNDEQAGIRQLAKDFCDRELAPNARELDRTEAFPDELVPKLFDVGFLGATIPTEYGGMGLDYLSYGLIVEETGRTDASIRSMISVNLGLVGSSLLNYGTEEQKQEWLPRLATEGLGAFGLTEPDHGSNPNGMKTFARRDGDDWVINGSKMWITNGSRGVLTVVYAQTDDGITAFLVPQDTPGYSGTPLHGKLGLRAGDTAELSLTDVRVPKANVLGEIGKGLRIALHSLDNGRFSLAAGCTGISQACLDASLEYALEREQFGKKIGGFQLVQELLSDIYLDLEASRALTWKVAWKHDKGERHTVESSVAKTFASEAAVRNANRAVQVHGGYGYSDEYPVGRYLRDARVTTLYEGTSQIQRLLLGRHLTGLNAFT